MRTPLRMIVLTVVAFSTAIANAQSLGPGSPAPALNVKTWYKGKPVTKLEKGKTYVVEFWATWCGPCKTSIPHLTELAKKNKDVQFIGVSIWEDDKGGNIKNFVKAMGAKMDYAVGYSGNKTGMAKTWMEAAGRNGIPSAFVVKDQKVMWIGHPMEMEKPLAEIKSGKFNVAAFKKELAKRAEAAKEQEAVIAKLKEVARLITQGRYAEADAQLDKIGDNSDPINNAKSYRLWLLAKTDPAAWEKKVTELSTGDVQQRNSLLLFASTLAFSKQDRDLATKAVEAVLASTKDDDTLAFFNAATYYSEIGEFALAVKEADRAIAAFPKSSLTNHPDLLESMKSYRAELAARTKG